jgi:glycosyltransferase involved in cell wall biosynthesis
LTIGQVVTSVRPFVDGVYVVDDGSTDSTALRASEAGARVISHPTNRGVGIALQTGYEAALSDGADLLIQVDADGQHDPNDLGALLASLDESTDIVIGSRFVGKSSDGYGLVRRLGIHFFSFLCSALGGSRIYDVTSGFRIFRASALSRLPPLRRPHWAVEQTLTAMRLGLNLKEVAVPIPPRRRGRSQFQPRIAALYPLRVLAGVIESLIVTSHIRRDGDYSLTKNQHR